MNYKEEIIKFCNKLGLDTIGFTKCRELRELVPMYENRKRLNLQNEFEEEDIQKRINPFLNMPEGKTIISIAFPYLFSESHHKENGFSKYTMGMDYHSVVMNYLNQICGFIESVGGKAKAFVDSNPLPERYIAWLCGIGFIGKNNMLITEKYGSYVFLSEIITDLEIEESSIEDGEDKLRELMNYERCGECSKCLEHCPTKAINLKRKNPNICLSYITQKKEIEDIWFQKLNGRLFGCDTCQNGCPYNEKVQYSTLQEFRPNEYMAAADLEELINIDNRVFREKYANTSCGWRGKNILQRNALISSLRQNKNLKPKDIKSPYVKNYYDRLLEHFKL